MCWNPENNILDLVITTEGALIVTLQINYKIGDHQTIKFSLQNEKEETAVEKTNYNFRRSNFDAMHTDLDDEIFERLIINSDAAQRFELIKNRTFNLEGHPKKFISNNNPSWINNDVK